MLSLIRGLAVLLICLGGIGLYRGWFSFSSAGRDKEGNKVNINVSVDENKLEADAERVEEKIAEKVAQRIQQRAEKAKTQYAP